MRIAAAINGTLTSEHAAYYALLYAQQMQLPLDFLTIVQEPFLHPNIEQNYKNLEEEARRRGVSTQLISYQSKPGEKTGPKLAKLLREDNYHTVFCSTRARKKRVFTDSVSQYLSRARIRCQVAIVKIHRVNQVSGFHRVGIFGGQKKPDLHQLALGLTLAKAHQGEVILSNPLPISHKSIHKLGLHDTRELLKSSDQGFRSLLSLCSLAGVPATIAHLPSGGRDVDYLLSRKIDLMALSAPQLLRPKNLLFEDAVEQVFRTIPINAIILFPRG